MLFSPHRESASCTHVSGLLHALVALCPAQLSQPPKDGNAEEDEPLPITSFACQWKQPRKRKESTLPMSEAVFHKPVYGRQQKHTLSSITDFDPRPQRYRGTAPALLEEFLEKVKGKGLGVSVLKDQDTQVWKDDENEGAMTPHPYMLPSKTELIERVGFFKKSLVLPLEKIREIERNTRDQSLSPLWFSVRRYRLTASVFGRILRRKPNTPADALVKELLDSKQVSSRAIEWGKTNECRAIEEYKRRQNISGKDGITVCKAGFHICEHYPFLGASPDGCIHDPTCVQMFGVLEVKCPYKYRFESIDVAATNADFCLAVVDKSDGSHCVELKTSHMYYSQVQGQLAITERQFCDFVVYTTKDLFIQRIAFNEDFWLHKLLPKLIDFYDNCFAPAIVSPIHILGMQLHDLRV